MNPPALDSLYDVPSEYVEEFRAKGHTMLRGVASRDEIDAYRPVIEKATFDNRWDTRPLEERDTYGKAFVQVPNLWRRDETVKAFVFAQRFATLAADLLGVDGVRLYHDQALFKEAGGGRTPWHQDQHYWPLDTDSTVTMWMPLVDVPPEIGTMNFVSGTHRMGYLGEYGISDESERAFNRLIAERELPVDTHGPAAAGDATFHHGWMLHSAPPNPTGTLRAVMTIIYFPDGTRVSEPTEGQRFDHKRWLRSIPPGELAASDLNPVLYSRSN